MIREGLKQRRQDRARRSLSRVPPTSTEAQDLHSFYLNHGRGAAHGRGLSMDEGRVWMGDTKLEKTMLMFPQERK